MSLRLTPLTLPVTKSSAETLQEFATNKVHTDRNERTSYLTLTSLYPEEHYIRVHQSYTLHHDIFKTKLIVYYL